jgi:hypothetical protein
MYYWAKTFRYDSGFGFPAAGVKRINYSAQKIYGFLLLFRQSKA